MFKSTTSKAIAIGLAGFAILIVWAAYYVGESIGETKGYYHKQSDAYISQAQKHINDICRGLNGADQEECISGVIQSTNEHKRAEKDFVAQNEMATWARLMFVITAAMAAITAIGVIYVAMTLRVTRDTLEATQKMAIDQSRIGEAQSMAYVYMSGVTWSVSTEISGEKRVNFTFDVANCGLTPCPRFEIRAAAMSFPFEVVSAPNRPEIQIEAMGWSGLPANSNLTGPIPVEFIGGQEAIINRAPKAYRVLIYGEIRYSTIYGDQFISEFEFSGKDLGTGQGECHADKKMSRTPRHCKTFEKISQRPTHHSNPSGLGAFDT